MANIVISNNGNQAAPAQYDGDGNEISPAVAQDPDIKVTDAQGNVTTIKPATSQGLPLGAYTIEVA